MRRRLFLARQDRQQEPIVALVDVVFFLLVFFLLVARLDATAPFEVMPPVAASGRDMPGGGVTLSVSRDGALAVNGNRADAGWLAAVREAALRENSHLIRINAHGQTEMRHVLPLITALEEAAVGEVVIVVTPPLR